MRTNIQAQVAAAMRTAGIDSLLLTDPANIGYLMDAVLPFVEHTPDRPALARFSPKATDKEMLYLFPDMAQAVQEQVSAAPCVAVYEAQTNMACLLVAMLNDAQSLGTTVGVVFEQVSQMQFKAMQIALPFCTFVDAGPLLQEARMVKLPEEIERIEMACRQVDTGLIGGLNHMEGAHAGSAYTKGFYTLSEFIERVRVHAYEGGTTMSGNMAVFAADTMGSLYAPQKGFFPNSEGLARVDYACAENGYWSVTSRMLHIGASISEQSKKACADNLLLKNKALSMLNPGTDCATIYTAIAEEAALKGIALHHQCLGFGVGRSEYEGPFLAADDTTTLQENMIIALDVATVSASGEIIRSVDMYAIGAQGPRLLSWHRNWDKPYAVTGYRNAH